MSKPVVFDDLCKKAKGTTMYHSQSFNMTAEARAVEGKPVVSKISGDFVPCDYCSVKKLSIDSTGAVVADVDFTKLLKKTTFTLRSMKDFNEVGLKKVGVGAKVLCDRVAFDCSFDIVSQRYHAGIVGGLPTTDFGLCYRVKDVVLSCVGYDLMKQGDLCVFYEMNDKTRLSGVCHVKSFDEVPEMLLGVAHKIGENTEVRCKVSSSGCVSGCFKSSVDDKMTFSGSLSVDGKDLKSGNNRLGLGVEFLF
ncbi:hypothetical protein JH06_5537 [Blastocystis sp. subtype 4]|uniref:hypothetical protein n=1 Tax=Blastocystis sp. subtype 4 TaxID=944170 RepID=UPI0007113823|nr:hypothetical protein JH06_5537 [Blastocystis sp. subtype 4]KNB42834.1 hypothetical protein JH06_5537 [Blastocystis sp. subtype 4]|eukprot:XP_014526277.1 hypothetical protein JH06_5537 [Blastocystis sp. subtype 4]